MQFLKSALAGLTVGLFSSVTHAAAADFVLEDYFVGKTAAEGHFGAINGFSRKFTVDLTGTWDGHVLTLREDFRFDDGTKDRKTWRFLKTGPKTYRGIREDVLGDTKVRMDGDTARFNYFVYLSPQTQSNEAFFMDKMVLQPDGTVLNTALVFKYGLPVAKTTVSFRKIERDANSKHPKHHGKTK
ncbi:DUF3833 family protein [Rhizobium sp.]|uniref:DUF3833 family protein n=1 Tax=Rhizobium sp. TaxID=391 RepID=UPI000E93916B|nr:DUF3833 domain-containing protein [Rhizobium sp.]